MTHIFQKDISPIPSVDRAYIYNKRNKRTTEAVDAEKKVRREYVILPGGAAEISGGRVRPKPFSF